MTDTGQALDQSENTAASFYPDEWLARWIDAGGGFAAGYGTPHLVTSPCACSTLSRLSQEIANPSHREALAQHLSSLK